MRNQEVKHLINLDADPFVPDGWEIRQHVKGGQFEWDSTKVVLYLSERQKDGKSIEGRELHKELEQQPVLNANVLDYLLAHPELIPEEWDGKVVYFWGTIYCEPNGYGYVRSLHRDGGQWIKSYCLYVAPWHGAMFDDRGPAAIRASN